MAADPELEVPERLPAVRDLPRQLDQHQYLPEPDRRAFEQLQQRRSRHADRRPADQRRDLGLLISVRRTPRGGLVASPRLFLAAGRRRAAAVVPAVAAAL